MGMFDFFKKKTDDPLVEEVPIKKVLKQIDNQVESLTKEREKVNSSDSLTPEFISNKKRRYHYKDVNVIVYWQYGGQYGKTCKSIGMKRGDFVELLPPQQNTDDPDDIAIKWKGIDIGIMKPNKLRSMVHEWKAAGLPVLAIVSQVGGEQKLFLEFAFYGFPKR